MHTTKENPKLSREDYMSKRCTHRQYYAQFVTPTILWTVRHRFTEAEIRASKDPHFNNLPLAKWDAIAQVMRQETSVRNEYGDGKLTWSLAGAICILKEAAQQIRESATT